MSLKPETKFRKTTVLPFLKKLPNTHVFPIQQVAIRGTPDLLICVRGWFVGLELKASKGRLSALQYYNLEQIEKCGGRGLVATPETWGGISNYLKILAGEPL